jgi:xanthine dehydrogenase accessory factor
MQAVDDEVLNQVRAWLDAGERCWLCTVIETWGSSPRPVGSLFACIGDGRSVGSLSGGCVEDDLLEKLGRGELADERPALFRYGVSADESEKFGLPCGGSLLIAIEPLEPDPAGVDHVRHITERLAERGWAERRVDLRSGERSVAAVDGFRPLRYDERSGTLSHTCGPRHQLFIIGAGMVSRYLAELALKLDYQVTVCDPRQHLLDDFQVPGVRLINDMPDDAVRRHASDAGSAIVALTHDPRIDDMGLMEALTTDAFYVGAMGSSRTSASRRERLRALDIGEDALERLHAPIGLAIGSKTPPEIAIAILAELIAVRAGLAGAGAAAPPAATAATG